MMKRKWILVLVVVLVLAGGWYLRQKTDDDRKKERIDVCQKSKEKIERVLLEANFCQKDSDCRMQFNSCPYVCVSLMNKAKAEGAEWEKILGMMREREKQCGQCMFGTECKVKEGELKCVEGKCVGIGE